MIDGWEERLNDYIDGVRNQPFEWGLHDCFTFTNEAVRAMSGEGYGDDWAGKYLTKTDKPRTLRMMQRAYGFKSLTEALDGRFKRLRGPTYPRGSIVTCEGLSEKTTTGQALGISLGVVAAFVDKNGLQFIPINLCERGWKCQQ